MMERKPMEKAKGCLHCRINKNAVKPYIEMKRLTFKKPMSQVLDKVEQEGQNPSCYVCGIMSDFIKGLKT
jgi:hypothetical protein